MDERDPLRDQVEARLGLLLKSKWRLDALLGIGGMAAVYSATHRNSKRVAVKILHPDVSIDEQIRARFQREGYVANRVGHPGAVDIIDDDVAEDGSAFLVMELLDGENLDRRLRRKGGRLPVAEVLSIADQVLDVLAAAHERGILHRDIKPENVFLTRGGTIKLLDFGIARIHELRPISHATQRGAVLGTPAFMPPEQAMAIWEEVDERSDVWALGATLFMLLTGEFVHPAVSGMQALDFAVNRRARSVATLRPDVPPTVVALIDRALAFEKSKRFQSAREMQQAVRAAYAVLEAGEARAPMPSFQDDGKPPKTDFVSTAPASNAPPYEAGERARTIVSKNKKTQRRRRLLAVLGAVTAVAGAATVATLAGPFGAPPPSPGPSAEPASAPRANEETPPATEPSAPEVATVASARTDPTAPVVASPPAPAIPVIAASALPAAAPPDTGRSTPHAHPKAASSAPPEPPSAATTPPPPAASASPPPAPAPQDTDNPFSGRY